jgi:membrane-associated phospholipid phosphatase
LQDKAGDPSGFQIENYLQYAPIAEMYIADAFKVKSKHHWFDQTKYLIISNIITSGITHSVKYLTSKTRPNGADYSFPSGHTSFSFTNASVLYNEFRKSSPVLAYSGYAFALTTGTLRMVHNKHWLSDVLVGAGLGILVTDLVYYFEPFKNFNPFKKSKNITFFPLFNEDKYGFYFSYKF